MLDEQDEMIERKIINKNRNIFLEKFLNFSRDIFLILYFGLYSLICVLLFL
jgi:hypothetical protein